MQPTLQLPYNSQSGNGIAGLGFSLSGNSSITRVGSNLFDDGDMNPIRLSRADKLALDGKRLVLVKGYNLCNGAKYRTQEESYSDITFFESNGESYFETVTQSGWTMLYGASDDSQIEAQGTYIPAVWALTKVTDPNGNYMTYKYGEDNAMGEFWLDRIRYTGNSRAGVEPMYEIVFTYQTDRPDPHTSYLTGRKRTSTKLLESVRVMSQETQLHEYRLSYHFDGFYSKLSSISLTAGNGEHYNPTLLTWGDGEATEGKAVKHPSIPLDYYDTGCSILVDDLNNDGVSDFVKTTIKESVGFSTTVGEVDSMKVYLSRKNKGSIEYEMKHGESINHSGIYTLLSLDLNNNGTKDLVEIKRDRYEYYEIDFLLNNGKGEFQRLRFPNDWNIDNRTDTTGNNQFEFNDFDGDGEVEQLTLFEDTVCLHRIDFTEKRMERTTKSTIRSASLSSPLSVTDFNGNGRQELYNRRSGTILEYDPSIGRFLPIHLENTPSNIDFLGSADFADMNGDGKTDIVHYNGYKETLWNIWLSTGKEFVNAPCPLTKQRERSLGSGTLEKERYFYADYNDDGSTDILEVSSSAMTIYYNTGDNFVKESFPNSAFKTDEADGFSYSNLYYNKLIPFHDMTGDGKCDLISLTDKNIHIFSFETKESGHRLASITNGMGETTHFDYRPLSDERIYENGNTEISPQVAQICLPFHAVAETRRTAGAFSDTTEYAYKGLRCHLRGRGILGFEEFAESNTSLNKRKRTRFGYEPELFLPYPMMEVLATCDEKPILTTTYEYAFEKWGEQKSKRFFLYPKRKRTTDHLTTLITTIETEEYEDGNPKTIRTQTGDLTETQTMEYVQRGSWCKNRVSRTTTRKNIGKEEHLRTSTFEYDSLGNLTKETQDPDDENELTIFYKDHNVFGKACTVERSANGVNRKSHYAYNDDSRFITEKSDEMGQKTYYEWDEKKNLLLSTTDRRGSTQYSHNGFGEVTETLYADGTKERVEMAWASPDNPLGARYRLTKTHSESSPCTTWFDATGREVLRETFGLKNRKTSVFTEYFPDGKIRRVSEPTFASAPEKWATTYEYDEFGRIATSTSPMGETRTEYGTNHTTVTTPDGWKKTSYNHFGEVASVETNGKTVNYEILPSGKVKSASPEEGAPITMEYDLQGNRTKLTDPDGGVVENRYNGFGELLWTKQKGEEESDGTATFYDYSEDGRLERIERNGETTSYEYDENLRISSISSKSHKQNFTYDKFDRITKLTEVIDGKTFSKSTTYTPYGKVLKEVFPSGYSTVNHYDENGILTAVTDSGDRSVWELLDENAQGQATLVRKGGRETRFEYDSQGRMVNSATEGIVDMTYGFDPRGNLTSRTDNLTRQEERFTYDELNRLTDGTIYQGGIPVKRDSIRFDENGNIVQKSDLGESILTYGEEGRPHALSAIEGDATGIPSATLDIAYTDFKRMNLLTEGDLRYEISYGVDEQRRKSTLTQKGKSILTRTYFGNYEEEEDADGHLRKIHYLAGGSMLVRNGGRDSLLTAHHDLLGSLVALTDEEGNVLERYAYDPWGERRNPGDWTLRDTSTQHLTDRGYTGHEHIDAFRTINMNGRAYDPATASFLSPDPYIQAPDNWLNYNRYSYCLNNPFRYTDPSGKFAIAFISGFGQGLVRGENPFKTAWEAVDNEGRIITGLFQSDPNKSLGARVEEVFSRLTLQAPQTGMGLAFSLTSNWCGQVDEVDYYGGATVCSGNYFGSPGAVTLGSYINGSRALEADPDNSLFQHEYGHYLQSQEMGPGYLSRVGVPSLMSTAFYDDDNHKYQPYEQDANRRAFMYFNREVDGFYKTYDQYISNQYISNSVGGWDFIKNPLDVYHEGKISKLRYYDYKKSEHIELINSLELHTKPYDHLDPGGVNPGIINGLYYNKKREK